MPWLGEYPARSATRFGPRLHVVGAKTGGYDGLGRPARAPRDEAGPGDIFASPLRTRLAVCRLARPDQDLRAYAPVDRPSSLRRVDTPHEPAARPSLARTQAELEPGRRRSTKRVRVAVVAFVVVAEIVWIGALAWGVWRLYHML